MKKILKFKLSTILTICTAFILCFSYVGNSVYGKMFTSSGPFAENTKISSIDISNLSQVDALNLLVKARDKWNNNTKISLSYKEKDKELDLSLFYFEIENSIEQAESGKENKLIVKLDEKSLKNVLTEISAELTSSPFNFEQFTDELLIYSARLDQGQHRIKLQDYFSKGEEDEIVAESTIKVGKDNKLIQQWANEAAEIEILPHGQFSMLKTADEKGMSILEEKTLSMISSAIYKTMLSTNFDITERHISRSLPDYVEASFEAKVNKAKNMDFIVTNPNDQKYILQFKYTDNLLTVSLTGPKFIYQYDVLIEDKVTLKPKKIYHYDAKLRSGEKRTEVAGVNGVLVTVKRDVADKDGMPLRTEVISEDFYPPVHNVIVQSLIVKETATTNSGDDSKVVTINQSNEHSPDEQKKAPQSNNNEKDAGQKIAEEDKLEDDDSTSKNESDIWGKQNEPKK